MRRETSDGQTERGDLSFGVPQGFAQLHSGRATKGKRLDGQARRLPRPTWQSYAGLPPEEGACVTFYALRPLERGDTVLGDFGASLEMIIGPRSSPGSESSEDSEGVVSPTAMIIKSALRGYLLCLQCCMT